ncbi:hypothetical protein C5B91_05885 [Haloferax sp. Atlit-10N]|uniref:Luciferase domain-containing protein n=1 Tax=Haloferax prahovense (strain DSM 18310 / JCM 13924 / TL6) TaxID=1227461 RepID=M0GFZ2_HALPT|nr:MULTISPECIES: luciferase family protein [Haloferax]ELZ71120.1 hypothetical protein C457_07697 [Haloferax prahovense DSM 18310]RDZ45535.1 hypothetical protein C5B86_07225 [Haloferax sp. Atlit-19N]RDZ47194.1 hypothetical protein C5B87_05885 [Haloferax sp. Atlit-16N]RDZ61025.1 hypothetical protein C5B91_05885 [Haloferax sp. Atlit-10N]
MTTSIDRIVSRVSRWPGVETAPHRFGGTEFLVAGREIGHVHDAGVVDLALTKRARDVLLTDGLADPHHVLPDSAWVTYRVRSAADVPGAMRLLRLAYLWRLLALRRRGVDLDPAIDPDTDLRRLGLPADLDALVRETFRDTLDRRAPV